MVNPYKPISDEPIDKQIQESSESLDSDDHLGCILAAVRFVSVIGFFICVSIMAVVAAVRFFGG